MPRIRGVRKTVKEKVGEAPSERKTVCTGDNGGKKIGLTWMLRIYMLMHMRTAINIDESLLKKAARLTGFSEKTLLVRRGLEALIAQESGQRLARLGGTEKKLSKISRRRPVKR